MNSEKFLALIKELVNIQRQESKIIDEIVNMLLQDNPNFNKAEIMKSLLNEGGK